MKKIFIFIILFIFSFDFVFSFEEEKVSNYIIGKYSIEEIKNFTKQISKNLETNEKLDLEKKEKIEKVLKKLKNYVSSREVKEIILGYSVQNRPIIAYYNGDLDKPFFGIFSNIHGGYEWETYLTAVDMIDYFHRTGKTQRLVIPTINPDGLEIARADSYSKDFYLEARENANGIDLNRNFCTKDFKEHYYLKKERQIYSGKFCMSEPETLAVKSAFEIFSFYSIISLHSEGNILLIPDSGINDKNVLDLRKKLLKSIPDYKISTPKNKFGQINSLKTDKYFGLMENWIYEYFGVSTVLVEFKKHGVKENRLLNIFD